MNFQVKNRGLRLIAISLTLMAAIYTTSCARDTPEAIEPGKHHCAHCSMTILDMRFNAQLATAKGKVYNFDSIECLVLWQKAHRDEKAHRAWVKDFYQPDRWVEWQNARYLHSKKLPSPMGAFLSSYANDQEVTKALNEYGGEKIESSKLEEFLSR